MAVHGFDPDYDLIYLIKNGRPILFEDFVQDNINAPNLTQLVQELLDDGSFVITSPPFFSIEEALKRALEHEAEFPDGEKLEDFEGYPEATDAPKRKRSETESSDSNETSYSSDSDEEEVNENKKIKT
jgi:hypothetical protein